MINYLELHRFFSWSAYLRVLPGLARKRRHHATASREIQTAVQCSTRGGVKSISSPLGAWSPACFHPFEALISSIICTLLPSSGKKDVVQLHAPPLLRRGFRGEARRKGGTRLGSCGLNETLRKKKNPCCFVANHLTRPWQ